MTTTNQSLSPERMLRALQEVHERREASWECYCQHSTSRAAIMLARHGELDMYTPLPAAAACLLDTIDAAVDGRGMPVDVIISPEWAALLYEVATSPVGDGHHESMRLSAAIDAARDACGPVQAAQDALAGARRSLRRSHLLHAAEDVSEALCASVRAGRQPDIPRVIRAALVEPSASAAP